MVSRQHLYSTFQTCRPAQSALELLPHTNVYTVIQAERQSAHLAQGHLGKRCRGIKPATLQLPDNPALLPEQLA